MRRHEARSGRGAVELGGYLADARRRAGLDARALAHYFGVPVRFVELIEQGRFHDLPDPVHARGYVRCLATALGLDQEAITLALTRVLGGTGIVDPALASLCECVRPRSPSARAVPGIAVEGGDEGGGRRQEGSPLRRTT